MASPSVDSAAAPSCVDLSDPTSSVSSPAADASRPVAERILTDAATLNPQRTRALNAALARAGSGAAGKALAGLLQASAGDAAADDENTSCQQQSSTAAKPPAQQPLHATVHAAPADDDDSSQQRAAAAAPAPPTAASVRQVLFDPARFFTRDAVVTGTIVVLDLKLGRLDLAADGAKMIVHIGAIDEQSSEALLPGPEQLACGSVVNVVGRSKKSQRRTFFEARSLQRASSGTAFATPGESIRAAWQRKRSSLC